MDEGINDTSTLDVTLPIFENHLTCDEDDEEEEDVEDPVERPPEPTVPDERVDSSSGESSRRESVSPTTQIKSKEDAMVDAFTKAFTEDRKTTEVEEEKKAITSMLSEIVGTDKPYETYDKEDLSPSALSSTPNFAMRMQNEATSR